MAGRGGAGGEAPGMEEIRGKLKLRFLRVKLSSRVDILVYA